MQKGVSLLISSVMVILISVVGVGVVLGIGLPLIDKFSEAAVVSEAQANMLIFDNTIRQVASEGTGIVKEAQFRVSDGTYRVNPEATSLDFDLVLKSDLLPRGTFRKDGNVQTSVTGASSATQNSTNIIIENEIIEVVFGRIGNETSFDGINTSNIVKSIRFKDDNSVIIPNDTSVKVGNITNTSWGLGYTKIAREGTLLPRSDVLAHVRSNMTGVEYDVLYTLPGSADYLLVTVKNVTNNKTTINYAYRIGTNSSDKIKIGNLGNLTSFSIYSSNRTSSSSNSTLNLQNTNYTRNSSALTIPNVPNNGSPLVYYNASDGTWRNVTELGDIGQGNWSYSTNSTNTTINFTLAGSDGYDFGVRDSLAGGSYWTNPNGTIYAKFNVSNDFVTVGLTENNLTVYNSSKRIIFNSSFNDAVRVDNQNLISLYGPGTQNKTVYFFDWANQSWKVWTRAAANSTHGMPDWLDPRNKQAFKWRYEFRNSTAQARAGINITFMVTAHDPFVRMFVDALNISASHNVTVPFSLPENRTSVTTAEPGLVGYWNLNEVQGTNATDSSGNANTGTLTGTVRRISNSSCKFGNCISLDGSTGYVTITSTPKLHFTGSGKATLTAWVYPYGSPANRGIIGDYGASGGDNGAVLWISAAGNLAGTVTATGISSTAAVPANQWSFVALTYDSSSNMNIYLNGNRVGTAGAVAMTDGGNFNIGVYSTPPTGGTYFNGIIDEPRAYSRVLSASELRQLYLTGVDQQKPGIYFTKNNATDNEEVLFATTNWKNVNHSASGNVTNFNVFSNHTDFFGFNYTFNSTMNQNLMFALGTMGRMNTTTFNPQTNQTQFSNETMESVANSTLTWYDISDFSPTDISNVYAWYDASDIRTITKDGSNRISQWNDKNGNSSRNLVQGTGGSQPLWVSTDRNDLDVIDFSSSRFMSTSAALSAIPQPITAFIVAVVAIDDDLPHVALDAYGTSERIVFFAINDPNGDILMSAPTNIVSSGAGLLGTWRYVTSVANATTSEVRVDGVRRLSGDAGSGSYAGIVVGSNRLTPGVFWQQKISEVIIYDKMLDSKEISQVESYLANKWGLSNFGSPAYNVTNITGGARHTVPADFNYDGGAAGIWRFDEGSGLNASDSSGGGNVGTLTNGPTWISNSSCKYGSCLSLDGSDDYVAAQNRGVLDIIGRDITLEAWINLRSASTNSMIIANELEGGGGSSDKVEIDVTSGLGIQFCVSDGTTWNCFSTPNNAIATNAWSHVVAKQSSEGKKIFVNGVHVASSSTATSMVSTSRRWTIGAEDGGTLLFNGLIDEARVYPRAIAETEIREHYQREVTRYYDDFGTAASGKTYRYFGVEDSNTTLQPVTPKDAALHYRFNDNSTANVTDSSGRGNNGGTIGPLWTQNSSCNLGGCMFFDGSNDYVTIGSSTSNFNFMHQANAKFAITFWYKSNNAPTTEEPIMDNQGFSASTIGTTIVVKSNRVMEFYIANGGGVGPVIDCVSSNNFVPDDNWHFYAITYDHTLGSNNCRMTIDTGNPQLATKSQTPSSSDASYLMHLGKNPRSGTVFLDGVLDEFMIINKTLTTDEVNELYLGGVNRTVGGKWHRVASADDLQSMAFNLTAKNGTNGAQDYSMRMLLANSTLVTTVTTDDAPAHNCFTVLNISQPYACSLDDSEYSQTKSSGLLYAGSLASFGSICNDAAFNQTGSPYKFNLTASGQTKVVIPFANAACSAIGNKTDAILSLGFPPTPFGSYVFRGLEYLQMSLQYDRIKIDGDLILGRGSGKACFKKTGQDGARVVVNVTSC